MAQSESSIRQPITWAEADEKCRFVGRCDDSEICYDYPTAAHCCHTEKCPHRIELSYQASTCLSNEWTECKRYRTAMGLEAAHKPDNLSATVEKGRRLPVWAIAGIVVVAGVLTAGLYFALNTIMANGRLAPSPSPTSIQTTQALAVELTVSSRPTRTSSPTPSDTPWAMSTHTDTPVPPSNTPTPMPTCTPSPTSSQTPSATAGRTPSLTPSRTPSPTPTPGPALRPTTPIPTPTPTDISFPALLLLAPPDQRVFLEGDEIVLDWQSVGPLPPDVFYVPIIAFSHHGAVWTDQAPWTQDTRWTLSEHHYLLDLSDDGLFCWAIQVMLKTGVDETGWPVGRPVSPQSEERTFHWIYQEGGLPIPTKEGPTKDLPTPPPPPPPLPTPPPPPPPLPTRPPPPPS